VETPSTRLRLRVIPGAARTAVVGRYGDGWKVRVAAAPERGGANKAVLRLLADRLGVPERRVRLVAGYAARDKIVEVDGLGAGDVDNRLGAADGKDRRA
jgi:uncharacterized protein YggU (UPF0235/DUF167 family)